MAILDDAKVALRILNTTDYDSRIASLIEAAESDLGIAGVSYDNIDAIVEEAIITYVLMKFPSNGTLSSSDYERLKSSYDEQKAQLSMATGYTEW